MKNFVLFLTFVTVTLLSDAFSQVTTFNIMDSSYVCSSSKIVTVFMSVGAMDEVNPIITVSWGDGSSSVIDNETYSANSYELVNFEHQYNNIGTYTVTATFESTMNTEFYTSDPLSIVVPDLNYCGYVYTYVYQNTHCGAFWGTYLDNAVFDLTDNNNTVTQFTGTYLEGVNVNNAPYTVSINDDWLAENNLTQVTTDLIITGFDHGNPIYQGQDYMFTVSSYDVNTLFDASVLYGYSACFSPTENGYINFSLTDMNCAANANILVTIDFPAFMTPVTAGLTNPVINGTTLTYEIHNFNSFGWYYIPVSILGTTEGGQEYTVTISISDMDGMETELSNNTMEIIGMVFNSYDPNDKIVNRATNLDPNAAEELQYTINFQNEGNFAALKVVVRDTLSENLDLATFKVLHTKHNVVTTLDHNTRVATFTFDNINLVPSSQDVDGSKGQIVYEVKEKTNLPVNSEIENTAYIYFDFNPAIVTNTTYNTNTVLSVNELNKASFSVYPNPANNAVKVNIAAKGNKLQILDLNGKEVFKTNFDNTTTIDISGISNGIYSLVLENKNGISIEKLVVQH